MKRLFGNDKDITDEYRNTFVGMTTEPVSLDTLLATRARLRAEMPQRLTDQQRQFLKGVARARPDAKLLEQADPGHHPKEFQCHILR